MAQQMKSDLARIAADCARPVAERVEALAALQKLDDPEVPELMRRLAAVFRSQGKSLMARGIRMPDYIQSWFQTTRASWSLSYRVLLLDLAAQAPAGLFLAARVEGEELRTTQLRFVLSAPMRKQMHEPSVNFPALALQPDELPVVFHRAPKLMTSGPKESLVDQWYSALAMLLATVAEVPGFKISAAILGKATGYEDLRHLREPARGPAWEDFQRKAAEPDENDVRGSVATMSFFPAKVVVLGFATLEEFHARLLEPADWDVMFHQPEGHFLA